MVAKKQIFTLFVIFVAALNKSLQNTKRGEIYILLLILYNSILTCH